jgi:hypothetical protein
MLVCLFVQILRLGSGILLLFVRNGIFRSEFYVLSWLLVVFILSHDHHLPYPYCFPDWVPYDGNI